MYQRILVPFDGSATSQRGLDEAIRLAVLTGARLRLIYLIDDLLFASGFETYATYSTDIVPFMKETGRKILEKGKARVDAAGVAVETAVLEGMATRLSDVVAREVAGWNADLVVIGTHGRRGVGRLMLGSDAEQIVRSSRVPVMLVRAPEAAEPMQPGTATAPGQAVSA